MKQLTMEELLALKGGVAQGCAELLQYEANTHEAPDCSDPELIDKMEKEYWDDWAERYYQCTGVRP